LVADQLSAAARSVADFAERLLELQAWAARLAATAVEEGLSMDPAGGIAHVDVPYGPFVEPAALAAQQQAQHRADVRDRLVTEVAALRTEEDEAHRLVSRTLTAVVASGGVGLGSQEPVRNAPVRPPADADDASRWAPSTSDWPAALGLLGTKRLSDLSPMPLNPGSKSLALVRTAPGMGVVSGALGVHNDVQAGYSVEDSVVKQVVVVTASTAAGAAAAGAVTAAGLVAAPAVAAAAVGIAVTAGAGYVGSRVWDAAFGPDLTPAPRSRRGSRARVEPAQRRKAACPARSHLRPGAGPHTGVLSRRSGRPRRPHPQAEGETRGRRTGRWSSTAPPRPQRLPVHSHPCRPVPDSPDG
jgi:hypothetical protein